MTDKKFEDMTNEELEEYVKKNINERYPYHFYSEAREILEERGLSEEKAHKLAIRISNEALKKVITKSLYSVDKWIRNKVRGLDLRSD